MKSTIIPFVELLLETRKNVKVTLRTKDNPCTFYHMLFFKNNKHVGMFTCITKIPSITPEDAFSLASDNACCSVDGFPVNVVVHEVSGKQFELPKDISFDSIYKIDYSKHEIVKI